METDGGATILADPRNADAAHRRHLKIEEFPRRENRRRGYDPRNADAKHGRHLKIMGIPRRENRRQGYDPRNADATYRRHLKIMGRLKRFYLENYCYFVTSNCYRRRKYFKKDENKNIIIEYLKYYKPKYGFKLKGFVLLEDHFHLLIIPRGKYNISWIMKSLKVAISKRVKGKDKINDPIWQHRFYDHIVRNEQDFKEILNYIHNNLGKHNLCESLEEYRYSSFRNYYLNDHSLIEIDMD